MRVLRTYVKIALAVIFACATIVLLVPIVMRATMHSYTYISTDLVPKTEVVIIPGASVIGRKPSPILANRADMAIRLYKSGKASKILVTGDDDADVNYDEVTPVRNYLIDAGVPARDIFLDHAGLDTYSSMYRTIEIFGARSATIVTQDFHLPRALYIARRLGLNAYGMVADGQGSFLNGYVREIPASVKALLDLILYRLPASLGPSVDLKGDGQMTWH